MPLYRITAHSDDLVAVLNSTTQELIDFRKKATNNETRLTDQDLASVIDCLQRREHYLETLFGKRLTVDKNITCHLSGSMPLGIRSISFKRIHRCVLELKLLQVSREHFMPSSVKSMISLRSRARLLFRPTVIKLDVSQVEPSEDENLL